MLLDALGHLEEGVEGWRLVFFKGSSHRVQGSQPLYADLEVRVAVLGGGGEDPRSKRVILNVILYSDHSFLE